MGNFLPLDNNPSDEEILTCYDQYEWRPLFNGGERIKHSGIIPRWKGDMNRSLGRPDPDWRFANDRLYMGTDVMGIGNPQKEGEYKICFETTVLPVHFILWRGSFPPIWRGEPQIETGVDIAVTQNELSVSVYKRDLNSHFVGSAKNISLPSEKMELHVIVFLEKGKKEHTGSVWFKGREMVDRFPLEMATASVTLFSGIYKEISFRGSTAELQRAEEKQRYILDNIPSLRPYIEEGF